jgi:GDP-4-dehydro-6-deoxy-D-mannose reductase
VSRVLVTGGGGALGRPLVGLLRERGDEVTIWTSADVDVTDAAAVRSALRATPPALVFHLAGTREPERIEAVNVGGFTNLVEPLLALNVRVVIAGSSAQYGLRDTPRPLGEDEAQDPEGAYGRSKAEQERLAFASGLDVVCARLFNLIGPFQRPGVLPADLVHQLTDETVDRLAVRHLVGTRDFVSYADAARGLLLLAERGLTGAAYNVSSGNATPLRVVAVTLLELSGS